MKPARLPSFAALASASALAVAASMTACSSATAPQLQACQGDASACLGGSASVHGFSATPKQLQANLFSEFPTSGAVATAIAQVGADGTFTFSQVPAGQHYYVQVQADFGQGVAAATFVGPLTMPGAAALVAQVSPVQLIVLEQQASGSPREVQSAQAFVFDPGSGAPLAGATVTFGLTGGETIPMTSTGAQGTYAVTLPAGTAAQSTYTAQVTFGAAGSGQPSSWQTSPATATFTPTLTAPAVGATVPAGQALSVSWAAQPLSDDEILQLFAMQNGQWTAVYQPAPVVGLQATIPGSYLSPAGQALLLNVAFVQGNCPATADGCVATQWIAGGQITPQ